MKQWKVSEAREDTSREDLQQSLNEYENEGWNILTVMPCSSPLYSYEIVMWREKK